MTQSGIVQIGYGTEPSNPTSGKVGLYSLDGSELLIKNDAGTVLPIGGEYKIATVTVGVGGGVSSIDFTSIPATYNKLVIDAFLNCTVAADDMYMRVNGDAGANYDYLCSRFRYNGGFATDEGIAQTSAKIASITNLSGVFDSLHIEIPWYAQTFGQKSLWTVCTMKGANTTTNVFEKTSTVWWRSTAAINRVTLIWIDATTFNASSTATLYGVY